MKVIQEERSTLSFNKLKSGDVFMWHNDIFIKVSESSTNVTAVHLKGGDLFLFDSSDMVVPLPNAVLRFE